MAATAIQYAPETRILLSGSAAMVPGTTVDDSTPPTLSKLLMPVGKT
jgi:hypothetical protein